MVPFSMPQPTPWATMGPPQDRDRRGYRARGGPRRKALFTSEADPERVSQLQSGISFCHAESSALGQQNKEVREKVPLCLGLNARPAGKDGFPRARAEAQGRDPSRLPSSSAHPHCPQHSMAAPFGQLPPRTGHKTRTHSQVNPFSPSPPQKPQERKPH